MLQESLIGKLFVQNSGITTIKILKVVEVAREVAKCKAININTQKKGNVSIDLRTGNEYLYKADKPFMYKGM